LSQRGEYIAELKLFYLHSSTICCFGLTTIKHLRQLSNATIQSESKEAAAELQRKMSRGYTNNPTLEGRIGNRTGGHSSQVYYKPIWKNHQNITELSTFLGF